MDYKLFCTDIDGTLLNKDRVLSDLTIDTLTNLEVPVILISSRMPSAMYHLQNDINVSAPIIAYNGGLILDENKKEISTTLIDIDVVEKSIEYIKGTSVHISLYQNDDWFVPEMDYWAKREENNTKVTPTVKSYEDTLKLFKERGIGAHKIMCMGDAEEIDALYKKLEKLHNDDIILYRSKDTYIEIAHRSISKLTAINEILEEIYTDIKLEDIIAFGDNYNDIEMLSNVGIGVAVDNANDKVKESVKYFTDTNKNDGVAKFLINNK